MFKEFKEFISRGNVLDMAVGVVMGAAFKAIIDSLVANIIMPLVGLLTNGIDFSAQKIVLKAAVMEGEKVIKPELAIGYGTLIQTIINFLLISLCIFFMIKAFNKLHRKKEEAPAEEPAKPDDVVLLEEIRDLLKNK